MDALVDPSSDGDRLPDMCPNCGTSWCMVDFPPSDLKAEVCTEEETLLKLIRSIRSRADEERTRILFELSDDALGLTRC